MTKSGLRNRLESIEHRIVTACARAGRQRSEVTLVAVTKTVSIEVAALLPELGVFNLGESRPQELWRKAAAIPGVHWHLVGHLQRNKIKATLSCRPFIHSIDSLRLLEALEQEARRQSVPTDVLLEVNASREENKHGLAPEQLPNMVRSLGDFQSVGIRGLMTMAALEAEAESCRATFAEVRRLAEQLRADVPPPHSLDELSMGMSDDFEIAIAEGATMIRIGTALFEGLVAQQAAE